MISRRPYNANQAYPQRSRVMRAAQQRILGFTLIEVLVALVIVSLGIFAAVAVVSQSARTKTQLREKTFAHWVAMNVITEWRAKHSLPAEQTSGDMQMATENFHYEMRLSETGFKNLWMLEVSVSNADRPQVLDVVQGFINQEHLKPNPAVVVWDNDPTTISNSSQSPTTNTSAPLAPIPSVTNVGELNSPTDTRSDSSGTTTPETVEPKP